MLERLDPELAAPLQEFLTLTDGGFKLHDIPASRAMVNQMVAALKGKIPDVEGVTVENRLAPGLDQAPDVTVRIYQPADRPPTLPGLLWIHGGGYVFGNVEGDDLRLKQLVKDVRCVVLSVEYRLAPEHPFPAALEDCYAALKWLTANADELGVERSRIAIGGTSAGGGLAASLALLARDRAEVDVAFQFLIYPMLDDKNVAPASASLPDTPVWSRENNLFGWKSYLGRDPGGEGVSPYAAAFRATDLLGLPPTYIGVGETDLFLNESIHYAQRLLQAGIPTELHVYPGAFHCFDVYAAATSISQRFITERNHILQRVLHP